MSSVILSASVRQNLLSLQSTAELISATQTRLSTGKKVNSALDNPTGYFTASSLNGRASDINNLLDGIGNGVQVLQAANTGISSLQKLVDSAKSVVTQALQTPIGYSTKSNVTSAAITGATANNLLGSNDKTVTAAAAVLNDNTTTAANITVATKLAGTAGAASDNLASNITATDTIVVNGKTIAFNSGSGTTGSAAAGTLSIDVTTGTVGTILSAIDAITGANTAASITSGAATVHTGQQDLVISGTGLAKIGLSAGTTYASDIAGLNLTIGATGGGTASSITFGTGASQVDTLDELNTALAGNNLQATIDTSGKISITTSNDAASATIGTIGGTAAASGKAFNGLTAGAAVKDAAAQLTRAGLVSQYNEVIQQIAATAQDASFSGVNLLAGDTLKLVFNETGKSTLSITGVTFNPAGLGLSSLTAGTDFIDNNATTRVLTTLNAAAVSLRSVASSFGSNLSIVQTREDFSKDLISLLTTGASNLTLADSSEEAASSQTLSTRQSIAVSALALANRSQQSVLQLLR